MVIVNPETKGPVGDSHLGEVGAPFTFTPKSAGKNLRVHISKSEKLWMCFSPVGNFHLLKESCSSSVKPKTEMDRRGRLRPGWRGYLSIQTRTSPRFVH